MIIGRQLKEHVDDEKTDYIWFISFNGMCHAVCSVCSLRNKDNIPVQSSAIHPEEDRIFFIYSNPFIKESVLLSTSTGERFNRRTV